MPPLRRADLADDPIEQFSAWYAVAQEEVPLAEAMTLATVDSDGAPDARMVLLKGHGPGGFRFFTNYESAKGGQLDGSEQAALVLYWREQDRQVRVRGIVTRISAEDSDAYFASRPRDSRLGAWASPQSRLVADRAGLDAALTEIEQRFPDDVPRPPQWGGYLLDPRTIEFWQGRVGRLHDRFIYEREGAGWTISRLGP